MTVVLAWLTCRGAGHRLVLRRGRPSAPRTWSPRPSAACACACAPTCAAPAARSSPGRPRPSRCWAATSACWWRRGRSPPASAPRRASRSRRRSTAAAPRPASRSSCAGRITVAGDLLRPDRVTVVRGGPRPAGRGRCGRRLRADVRARAVGARVGERVDPGPRRRARARRRRGARRPAHDGPVHRPARPVRHRPRPAGDGPRGAACPRLEVPPAARGTHARRAASWA